MSIGKGITNLLMVLAAATGLTIFVPAQSKCDLIVSYSYSAGKTFNPKTGKSFESGRGLGDLSEVEATNLKSGEALKAEIKKKFSMAILPELPAGNYSVILTVSGSWGEAANFAHQCLDGPDYVEFEPSNKPGVLQIYHRGKIARDIGGHIGKDDEDISASKAPEKIEAKPVSVTNEAGVAGEKVTSPVVEKPKLPSVGIVNDNATSLPQPEMTPTAKAVGAKGAVNVEVVIDKEGNVVSAKGVTGHAFLRYSAVQAAKKAKFKPFLQDGQLIQVSGIIVYNF